MKTKTTKIQNTTPEMTPFEQTREAFLDVAELNSVQMDELDSINDGDFEALNSFIDRYNKLKAIEIPEKLKAIKLSDLTFDAVSVGGLFKFHYTDKAIKTMLKNNIVCDIAYTDNSIKADAMPEFDTAIVTAIDGEKITAISKENGIEYTLIPDDFDGIINGVKHSTYKNCLFGILPFTYKTPASVTA